jgi:hypothetical protein
MAQDVPSEEPQTSLAVSESGYARDEQLGLSLIGTALDRAATEHVWRIVTGHT